ncbi:MAG TPA: class I SAM-dependent methyltransferase [Tepidisphaeraceae bacterium]|jgi:predicted O-methyltransferase YrrM
MQLDLQVQAAVDELDRLARSRDDAWQIPREEGHLLYQIALTSNAKTIVEVGTSYGFSGLFWGAAMTRTGGMLHTIDMDNKKYESSRATFAAAGLDQVIMNYRGDAKQILAAMPGPIDIAFVDADKPATQSYFELLWPKIRVGGAIITDNALTHRAELADFVKHVRGRADAHSVEIPVGNGIEWTVKTK